MGAMPVRKSVPAFLITALTLGSLAAPPAPAAAAPTPGTSSCTEAGVTWTVAWTAEPASGFGPIVKVDALRRTQGGTTTDAAAQTWQLRWDNGPDQWAPATPPASVLPFQQLQGPLATVGGQWRSVFLSPRLVTPDGSCTVYLSPFTDLQGTNRGPRIAVLGDDLVQQLNESGYNANAFGGFVEGNLNGAGIRAEPEGQAGRRATPTPGTTGLARADTHLGDELRGLLEHDIDGVVTALGVNDALWIAAGATEADRTARRDEVRNGIVAIIGDLGRAPCVAVVTAPENPSSLDPDYQWAAREVNRALRDVLAIGSPTDNFELVDFGAQATTHGPGAPVPWFGADGVHLAGAGLLTYTKTIQQAAERCADSVVVWGAPGTLGDNELTRTGATALPSGQAWNTRAVPGFDFGTGKSPWFSTAAADGTIWYMVGGSAGNVFAASGKGMTISGFNPDAGSFTTIPVRTDRNVAVPKAPCLAADPALGAYGWGWCQPGQPWDMGGWIGDVATLDGGDAVAFTGYQLYLGRRGTHRRQRPAPVAQRLVAPRAGRRHHRRRPRRRAGAGRQAVPLQPAHGQRPAQPDGARPRRPARTGLRLGQRGGRPPRDRRPRPHALRIRDDQRHRPRDAHRRRPHHRPHRRRVRLPRPRPRRLARRPAGRHLRRPGLARRRHRGPGEPVRDRRGPGLPEPPGSGARGRAQDRLRPPRGAGRPVEPAARRALRRGRRPLRPPVRQRRPLRRLVDHG
jgi:hypothetical protein